MGKKGGGRSCPDDGDIDSPETETRLPNADGGGPRKPRGLDVGSREASGLGIVMEWCEDASEPSSSSRIAPNERPLVRGRPVFKALPVTFNVPNGLEALARRLLLPLGADGIDGPIFGEMLLLEGGTSSESGIISLELREMRQMTDVPNGPKAEGFPLL